MSKQKDRPDREKIAGRAMRALQELHDLTSQQSRDILESLIAPLIEEAKREERIGIGLQIQQQWSKATSAKGYSPYKLVDFLGNIITKLNRGQALREEK